MDPTVVNLLNQDFGLAIARQRDGAAFDMRLLDGVLSTALIQANEPSQFAGLNTGARIPVTLDQPAAVVAKTATT